LPSLFSRPRCLRPDTPSREAVVAAMVVVVTAAAATVAVAFTVVVFAAAVFMAEVFVAAGFMGVVAATRILAVGISPSAIFTADRHISVHSPAAA
jgi:hypothetical protein